MWNSRPGRADNTLNLHQWLYRHNHCRKLECTRTCTLSWIDFNHFVIPSNKAQDLCALWMTQQFTLCIGSENVREPTKAEKRNAFEISIFYLSLVRLMHTHSRTHYLYKFNDVALLTATALLSPHFISMWRRKTIVLFSLSTITSSQLISGGQRSVVTTRRKVKNREREKEDV